MSTPAGSSQTEQDGASSSQQDTLAMDTLIQDMIRARGYEDVASAFAAASEAQSSSNKPNTIPPREFLQKLAVLTQHPARPGENLYKNSANVLSGLADMSTPINVQELIKSLGETVGSEDALALDPTDKQGGFRELETWVDGSLDMYRPEFRPILFPIFCHFYLDLIQFGFKDAALTFFATFAPSLAPSHADILQRLQTLLLPEHVRTDELAQRFRNEKYDIKMSRSGFGLLLGWLTEGIGGEAAGAGVGFTGETGKKGRASVMRVVNNHLRFNITSSSSSSVSPNVWEESTGLLSSLIPQNGSGSAGFTNPQAFNSTKGHLKLGPAFVSEELRSEADRVFREQAILSGDPSAQYYQHPHGAQIPGMTALVDSDLPPHPPSFKVIDVKREVEKMKDARSRIHLDPSVMAGVDVNSPQAGAVRARALPSICAYTLRDVPEGAPCTTFSPDTSLMAAGFSESYVRIWSLKGEKLRGMRSDFTSSSVKDAASLRKIKEKTGSTTRKLIGHSGPIYSVDFDPLGGSAEPPKFLLSSSADATTRLWSLDTMTNVVAYRGHQNPVWDVKWSPMGIYFATGSRDRTARLWSTDRTSCLRVYAGHLSDVDCVQFHPNSLYLATGSSDWTARLWDVQRGACMRVFIGHQGAVTSLAISPDGRYLASSGEDLAINLWDLGSGQRIKKMTGHTGSIYSLAFSAESSMIVSGGADWTVRCWDVKSSGGTPEKGRENGDTGFTPLGLASSEAPTVRSYGEGENNETIDLIATYPTKRTPITTVQFTPRNLCLVAGSYLPPDTR